jgi:hypothetical protein
MEELLAALVAKIKTGLPYLFDVQVIDDESLPPDVASYPCVGLMDGGTVHQSMPGKKDKDTLTVRAIAYQEIIDDKPGASIMGNAEQLGDKGKGVLAVAKDLRALLNDEFLGLGFQYAHLDKEDAALGLARSDGRMIAAKNLSFTYVKF